MQSSTTVSYVFSVGVIFFPHLNFQLPSCQQTNDIIVHVVYVLNIEISKLVISIVRKIAVCHYDGFRPGDFDVHFVASDRFASSHTMLAQAPKDLSLKIIM